MRNYFITGIIILVPLGFTLYLTIFLISISSKLIPEEINPNSYLPFSIPGLEIILSRIFITFFHFHYLPYRLLANHDKSVLNQVHNLLHIDYQY